MTKITVYRHDHRDFKIGEVMPPAGDHYSGLTGDQQKAEDKVRAGRPDGAEVRADHLYVYPHRDMAEEDWKHRKDRHLYELEIDEADIRHRGDLQIFHEVIDAVRIGAPVDEAVRRYWISAADSRYVELMVARATVVDRTKDASEYKNAAQRAIERLKDEPDNRDFYNRLFDGDAPKGGD
jgi:hypothetical protein